MSLTALAKLTVRVYTGGGGRVVIAPCLGRCALGTEWAGVGFGEVEDELRAK